uniref:PWI domain-containing protein n=1 Tax=Arcella intermedia TaxID=1963864 RepID=A0A6B2L9W9_9EUKA
MEIEYEKTEREWHEYEKDMLKERERQVLELAERKAKRKRDLLLDDEDDKVNRRNIRSRENRRRRMREKEEDERERAQEIKLEEARKQEALRREAEEQLKKKEQENLRMKQEQAQRWERGEMDVKGKAEQENFSFRIINETTNPELNSPMSPEQMEAQAKAKGFSVALKPAKRTVDTTKQLGFTDEPEEDTMVPKKIVLTSLDIEMSKKAKQNDARILAKTLIDQIPVEKEALFAYVIDWAIVEEKQIVEQKMRPWVTKKIVELLDEEEPTLIEYICKKLCDHSSPQDILDQLQVVLDDEASAFVIKMWRMLIFNMLNV